MKRIVIVMFLVIAIGVAGAVVLRNFGGDVASAGYPETPEESAQQLQLKIDAIKQEHTGAEAAPEPAPDESATQIEVSDAELESYVLVYLREKIPADLDSIDVQLTPGSVAADTQMTFRTNATGNPLIDAVMGGTHNFFVKGKLSGTERSGQFELEEIRLDGIPVPRVLVETLFEKYVKPTYPEADLKAPFELPWGIDSLNLEEGKATIVY
jgi:hypothetical protein